MREEKRANGLRFGGGLQISSSCFQFSFPSLLDSRNQKSRQLPNSMKKSGLLVAAASATAVSASSYSNFSSNSKIQFSREEAVSSRHSDNDSTQKANSSEKFAPRFDGLRFIETLVTAHR